ncbi:binding partner of ACD11 1 isoform X2 [Beta vulgaris subsp. vulgaris]|uniref:binding partner of ACD11 1 isoform X2 n=1 Tax=Beta vulgaris subsp. vulgaris TaxID=3555 RepID=UPI002036FB05|nr:binding partner of ACD11 1 isoform X2 [Beta vulgaris subsp. vulgaris]
MSARTVKVSNVSLKASERELKEFFSFSGDIVYLETKSENEESQTAYVTFKDTQGADTAVLLTGATIVDKTVTITLDSEYELPPGAIAPPADAPGGAQAALQKAEDVVTSMLAKGFILGKDAVGKAKSFDDKHQLTSTASTKIASLDQKIGLTEKISMGTSAVNSKVKEMDEKFQVSEKTKSALAVAEEKVSSAGSAIMKNRYVLTGTTWVTGAFNRVAKAAGDVGQKTIEKVGMTEDEQKRKMVDDYAQVHLSESDSPKGSSSPKASSSPKDSSTSEKQSTKPEPAQGLIL